MNANASSSKPLYEMYLKMKIYKETACQETATALLLHYEPIVRMAVGKMSRSRPDLYEDLFQVGQMSMLRLFTQYDSSMDIPFEAYAMKSLIGHLKNYLRDKSWYIQVPRRIKEKGSMVQRALDELTVKLERSPSIDEIAAYLELSSEETIEILAGRDYYNYTSLDTPLTSEGDSATIGDMIAGPTDDYTSLERRMDLEEAMNCLKQEERTVIGLIYHEGHSQRQIADQLGISQMSVSRIQKRAIDKLKAVLIENS
ncbi:RNA polymerase sigma factor SigB [Paenibacillus marchantiophytorum]|uniref:RNA polymerase sigma factor SigB n=1 Tax=Paenibacillus marchantiophytorum TaxID=1619310 RepID=A0ABQ1EPW5_9BACL|nr:sigma-70 family RNA polymerase sigma factor [Paenibacillus marchantiophytorum]GFZ81072.1 RNA polymerase sigma factor SigB [Paenibacillus marchantiophytorum]